MNDKLASINRHSPNVDNDMVETILALYNNVKLPIWINEIVYTTHLINEIVSVDDKT